MLRKFPAIGGDVASRVLKKILDKMVEWLNYIVD